MPLINQKVKLKLKWTKYFVLVTNDDDSDSANSNNIVFTISNTKLHVPLVTLSAKGNLKLSKCLRKGFQKINVLE